MVHYALAFKTISIYLINGKIGSTWPICHAMMNLYKSTIKSRYLDERDVQPIVYKLLRVH